MLKRRYEILLPLWHNDGRPVSDEKLNQTREELLMRFEGVSFTLDPIQGAWLHEGHRYEDFAAKVVVDVDDMPENRQFFIDYKSKLLERFEQIDMYIVSYPVEVV